MQFNTYTFQRTRFICYKPLIVLAKKNALIVLLPETTMEEWNHLKDKHIEDAKKLLNTKLRYAREMTDSLNHNILDIAYEKGYDDFEEKYKLIHQLLSSSIQLSITAEVKSLIPDRLIRINKIRKAPFHNKVDSIKDAYMILATLEYLKKHKVDNLLFISDNTGEFGDPKIKDRALHPDIANDYPSIQVDYYADIFRAINDYIEKLPALHSSTTASKNNKEESASPLANHDGTIAVDRKTPILNQLYYYLKIRFEGVKILPSYLFVRSYPFETGKQCYRNSFALKNVNPKLTELFNTFEIQDRQLTNNFKTQSEFKKASFILNTLSLNHIFYVDGPKINTVKELRVNTKKEKLTLLDKFLEFKFTEVFENLSHFKPKNTIDEQLKAGYFYYKIGDLIQSKDCFINAKQLAQGQNHGLTIVICNHNLYHLARSIEFRYYKLQNRQEIVQELKSIDNWKTEVAPHNEKIKTLILTNSFFTDAQNKLQLLKDEIVDKYQAYLRGVSNSNNFDWNVFYQYATLHQFLSRNYVVYEHYSDYEDVINTVAEAVFASYAIKKGMNRIEHLDDYCLSHFVIYGKTKNLEKYYRRYHLKKLAYTKTEEEDNIVKLTLNILSQDIDKLQEDLKNYPEQVGSKLWEDYNRFFTNLMFLCSILKLEQQDVRKVATKLHKFLKKNFSLLRYNAHQTSKYVYHFFIRQQSLLKPNTIKTLLLYSFKHDHFFNEYLNSELIDNSLKLKPQIGVTDLQLSKIILPFIDNKIYDNDRLNPYNTVTHIYPILTENQKKAFITFYDNILAKNYDHYVFYLLVVHDIMDISRKDYLEQFLNGIDLNNEAESRARGFFERRTQTFKRYPKIDGLLNMWFKYEFRMDDSRITVYKGLNDYYDWLLDLDHFDYSKFDMDWLTEYGTRFYYNHFRRSSVLKSKLRSMWEEDFDVKLRNIYYDIYHKLF